MTLKPLNMLISLHKGYGLGDCVQMSPVLQHIAHYRKHWIVDYQAEEGRHQVGKGIVANTFPYGKPYPHEHYDGAIQICLYDTWCNWTDRPNTRVTSCLHNTFDLPWNPELARYRINVSDESMDQANALVRFGKMQGDKYSRKDRFVAVHYLGDSSPSKKNLTHDQAERICHYIESIGCTPIILDWRQSCPITEYRRMSCPQSWGNNAEMVCAVISQCSAFVGIDSGPSKCASATDVPTLVVWTGYHPAQFHDPASNTTHLVPTNYHGLFPVCNDANVIRWFESNYNVIYYGIDPVEEISNWLSEVLQLS